MPQNKPFTIQEAADYLDISKAHLYKLTSTGRIPHFKPGGKRIYIYRSDLDEYIRSGRVKTVEQLETEAANYVTSGGPK